MNARTILAFSAMVGLLAAGDAAAQKLSLRIDKGLVTIDAENVTVDEVLARWIDTTGLNVVSKSGAGSDVPVSLHLEGVPEREALTTLLRDLSGYIMGERRDPLTGIVTIDRLMILPQSAAQAPATPATPNRRGPVAPAPPPVTFQPAEEVADPVLASDDSGPIESPAVQLAPAAPSPAPRPLAPGEIVTGAPVMPLSRTPIATADGNPFGAAATFSRPGAIAPVAPPPDVQVGSPGEGHRPTQ